MHVLFFVRRSERKRIFKYQRFDSRIIIGDQLSRNWRKFCGLYNLTRCRDEVGGSCAQSNELRFQ